MSKTESVETVQSPKIIHDTTEPIWKSDKIDKLVPALIKVQQEMGHVTKTMTNPFYKSKYADINAVIAVCGKPLNDNGFAYTQGNHYDVESNGFYIVTTLLHESSQWIKSQVRVPIVKKDPQAVGQAITYGRRYGLAAMVGLAQFDDDAEAAVGRTGLTQTKE